MRNTSWETVKRISAIAGLLGFIIALLMFCVCEKPVVGYLKVVLGLEEQKKPEKAKYGDRERSTTEGIEEVGEPAIVVWRNPMNFRTEPESTAPLVRGRDYLYPGEKITVVNRKGDWFFVVTYDRYEGWARARYFDEGSGTERVYIELEK